MEGPGSATIKQRSPSQAPRGRGNLSKHMNMAWYKKIQIMHKKNSG